MTRPATALTLDPGVEAKPEVRWHFAIPVYSKLISGYGERREAFVELLDCLHTDGPGIKKSNLNAWHSDVQLHLMKEEPILWLNREIGLMARECLGARNPSIADFDIVMDSCWANIAGPGGWNAPHNHYPSQWSGVFYIQVEGSLDPSSPDDKSGKVDFLNPIPISGGFGLPSSVTYTPRDGQMLLFPALLQHMVHPNTQPTRRYSMAFNLNVTRRRADRA